MKRRTQFKRIRRWGFLLIGSLAGLLTTTPSGKVEGAGLGGPTHIGTLEGSTTFTTSSSNGINPGLFIEVMDEYGNLTQYESEKGVITIPNTQEGAYVTQAKFLGKTKYVDQDTGEILDDWEENRNLKLTSVENPVLKIAGKNLFDLPLVQGSQTYGDIGGKPSLTYYPFRVTNEPNHYIEVTPNTEITFSIENGIQFAIAELDHLGNRLGDTGWLDNVSYKTIKTQPTTRYIGFNFKKAGDADITPEDVINSNPMLEYSASPTTYEPYQSHLLTVNETITLSGIGDVRDELDLITGEVVQKIGEIVLDGDEDWVIHHEGENSGVFKLKIDRYDASNQRIINQLCDKYPSIVWANSWETNISAISGVSNFVFFYNVGKLKTLADFKAYLLQNPITVQYRLEEKMVKTLFLDSTYYFQPVMNRDVYVDGSILPLVCSVTIPTESLAFVLNPNAEAGQQFIAPEFTVVNHTPTSIYLELKRFEQLTAVMNDVLPEAHEDWSQLNREQSKDIALALVPKPSEGWLNLEEGPRYVAEDSNYYLGEVKAESSVDFTFIASHGRAFVQPMDPKYRLSFVFDFFE